MEDQLITFETAKIAKEKGFDIATRYAYMGDSSLTHEYGDLENWNGNDPWLQDTLYWSAPTQSLLQKWLRDEHDIHINIVVTNLERHSFKYDILKLGTKKIEGSFNSYEEALEKGLQETLKIIT